MCENRGGGGWGRGGKEVRTENMRGLFDEWEEAAEVVAGARYAL